MARSVSIFGIGLQATVAGLLCSFQQPDIVVFLLDDVGYEDIRAVPTPNIDALAAQGVEYTRAYAHAWCAPTRSTLYWGWHDGRYQGDVCNGIQPTTVDDGLTTLPRVLNAYGYATYLVGKAHIGVASSPGVHWASGYRAVGWEHWRAGRAFTTNPTGCPEPIGKTRRIDDGIITLDRTHHTLRERDATIEGYLEAQAEGRPFFGMVAFHDAHAPWEPPPAELLPSPLPPMETERELFEAEIMALDTAIGEILAALGPDVLVIFTSDNGTPGPVAPDPERAKKTVFERGVHVPLIFAGPWGPPALPRHHGGQVSQPVGLIDVPTTILAHVGLPVPAQFQGQVLRPSRPQAQLERTWVFAHNPGNQSAVIEEEWKLIQTRDETLFYNLWTDPEELDPLPLAGRDYRRLEAILESLR